MLVGGLSSLMGKLDSVLTKYEDERKKIIKQNEEIEEKLRRLTESRA